MVNVQHLSLFKCLTNKTTRNEFLIRYCACDNDEENFDTASTGQVIKVPDDIKSFNSVTKEIVFEKNISIKQDVLGNEKVEFLIA